MKSGYPDPVSYSIYSDPTTLGVVLLVVGHALSRIAPIALIYFLEYVRDTAQARAKPVAQGMTLTGFLIGLAVIVR